MQESILLPSLLWIGVFGVSLLVLLKATDYFLEAAEALGVLMGMHPFVVGVTLVAIGTSFPELAVSVAAVMRGASEVVIANVVGSNIANIFLVLGVATLVGKNLKVSFPLIRIDLPILVGSSFLLLIAAWDGRFNFIEGLFFLVAASLYTHYVLTHKDKIGSVVSIVDPKKEGKSGAKLFCIFLVSSAFIYGGSVYTMEAVIELSHIFEIGIEVISVTAVALATSLPELVVSIKAARKGKTELAVGNVLGSNIFNTFFVMAIPSFFATLIIPASILYFGLPVMVMATLLYFFSTQDQQISYREGSLFVIFYIFFIAKQFSLF